MINGVRVKEGRKKYSVDELKSDVSSVLSKFVIKGGVGLKTINPKFQDARRSICLMAREMGQEVTFGFWLHAQQLQGAGL
jgi:hypothetical protein